MKYTKYILPLIIVAAGCMLYAYAEHETQTMKVKPSAPVIESIAPAAPPAVPQRLAAAEDGKPYGLHLVDIDNKDVTLRWNNPEAMNGYFDDFEGHADFAINSPGSIGWTYLDMDNENTYTWTATSFPTQGQKMAYVIMNPASTTPSVAEWPAYKPYSGTKMLVAFTVDGGNNDYIISPELSFDEDFQISFRAKSYNNAYGLERIRVGYSTTGNQASNFTFVTEGEYVEVPTDWTLYKYIIPKEAKYVTINCVSDEAFMLLIDDIFVGTNRVRPKAPAKNYLEGFNLYRDGEKINSELITELFYTDVVAEYSSYQYKVGAVYSDGTELIQDESLLVEVPDIRLLPFEDNFDRNVLEADKWSTPVDEDGNPSRWSTGYYSYGLVDFSAQYVYSQLSNYSQSLVTTELHTLDIPNTYLRFNLRHVNFNNEVGDTLAVEISCDNEQTWTRIDAFGNDELTFDWRVHQYSLEKYLTNKLFKIRFRAFGADAYYIDYWYVDDVKVWCPEWTSATLTVQSMGTTFANCNVHLEADHGAIIDATTDENGQIVFPSIEKGTYTVIITEKGYNAYSEQWTIDSDENNLFTANVLRPVIQLSGTEVTTSIPCEATATETLTITNTGSGSVKWNFVPQYTANSGDDSNVWNVQSDFDTSGDLQTSVAFDGEFFYTTSTYYLGKFFKYDKQGNFIEEFSVPGMYYMMYDMAFDGTYFYGSDYSNILFCLDLRNKRLVKEIVIESEPKLTITHCSYDSRNDQFWVGSFNSLGRIDRDGNVTVEFRNISTTEDMSVFGSAFDNVTPGGPYLWFSNDQAVGTNMIDQLQIVQYSLNTRKITPISHLIDDVPGYKIGTINTPNYICGIDGTTNFVDGTFSLVGIIKQSPSRIFVYEMAKAQDWLTVEPEAGTLQGGESQTITLDINARNGEVGKTYSLPFKLYTTPEVEVDNVTISYTVSGASETPRPTNLKAVVEGESSVKLTWEAANADGYNIYRNGKKVNEQVVTETTYTDTKLIAADYTYTVAAVYGDKESVHSDEVTVSVSIGAPYYAPLNLAYNVVENKYVELSWESPDATLHNDTVIRWDSGINNDALGISGGGYFWAGVAWDGADLLPFRNMKIESVDVYIQERIQSLSLQVYKNGKRIVSQSVAIDGIVYGQYNNVVLNTPLVIEPGSEYRVAFLVSHDSGLRPMGLDNTSTHNGKGNLVSTDGKEWFPLTHMGMSGNYNIAVNIVEGDVVEELPVGYQVYRNEELITPSPVSELAYNDEVNTSGKYLYQVASVYADGGKSNLSEGELVEIISLNNPVPPMNVVAQVEYNRTVHVRWDFPLETESSFPIDLSLAQATAEEGYPEYVSAFRGSLPGEMGIASDGEYIYTSLHNINGTICKYTLEGEFVSRHLIDGNMSGIRNIAYDGQDLFAADGNSSVYRIDIPTMTIVDTLSISEIARHIAYIPELDNGNGGFEVGDWESSIYVSKGGAKLSNGPVLKGAAGSAYHNGTLYTFEQGYDNPYMICCYDQATGELKRTIDVSSYIEITPETGAKAGGMSVIYTKEGLELLAVALQEQSNCRFIFFDLGSISGLKGYNIYRNGEKRNDEPVPFRYFTEDVTEVGTYEYQIETAYIDGSVSERSIMAYVDIFDSENCDAPIHVKAVQSSYGYNVNISFVDPTSTETEVYESFESLTAGTEFAHDQWIKIGDSWTVTDQAAYHGNNSLCMNKKSEGWIVIPFGKSEQDRVFSIVARNGDDHLGNGALRIYTSSNGNNISDFIPLSTIVTTEAWKRYQYTIPAGTDYVAIRHEAATQTQYIDAIAIDERLVGQAYGYDIMRDGEQINDELITDVTYIDRNLVPGTYNYQVRAYYQSSCISDYTEPVTINVDYSNGCQKPGMLFVERLETEAYSLAWSAPALGDVVNLRWHNGSAHDAAGMPSGGAYYAAVQWDSDDLKPYEKMSLSEIELYINQVPDALYVLVYEGNNLIAQQYVPNLIQYSFNTVDLNQPLLINTEKSLRVVVYVEHNEITVPLGYDEGPAKVGRGDLYSSDGITWSTLNANDIDGNWNITLGLRAYADNGMAKAPAVNNEMMFEPLVNSTTESIRGMRLAQSAESERNVFDGYNVYCNSILLNAEPLQDTYYVDSETHPGNYYEYQVKAIYSGCGEVGSNVVRVSSTSGVDGVSTDGISVVVIDNRVYITGLEAGTKVALCDTAGKVLHSGVSQGEYQYVINTAILPDGVYLVQTGEVTHKVVIS